MMFVHLLVLFFAAVEAIPSGRFDVVYPSMETFRSGIKTIRFRALDQDIELRLEPAGDVIADDFTLIDGENGEVDHSVDIQNLKRKLYKDAKIGAALHIDEDGPLTINGIVNSKLRIQPDTSKMASRNGIIAHRVFEVREDEHLPDDYKNPPPGLSRTFNYSEPLSDDKCVKLEYVFISEHKFTEKFKSDKDAMLTYLANMMNIVEILFDSLDLEIGTTIVGLITLTKKNEANLAPYITSNSEGMNVTDTLNEMAEFYCKSTNKLIKNTDIVMLITTLPLGTIYEDGSFVNQYSGLAYLDSACEMCYKYGVVRDDSEANERADTVAHESAHLLGCNHDGEGDDITGSLDCPASDGYIMGNRNKKNGRKFSPCCKKSVERMITSKIASTCMLETCDDNQKRKNKYWYLI